VYATDSSAWHPENVSIDVGGTVTWENRDTKNPHTVQCDQGSSNTACAWSTAIEMPKRDSSVSPPSRVSVTFPDPGTFAYYCSIHPTMTGTVVVGSGKPPTSSSQSPAPRQTQSTEPSVRATTSAGPTASVSARASAKATPKTTVEGRTTTKPAP